MTLSYWWMHWFWITGQLCFVLPSNTVTTLHSTSSDHIPTEVTTSERPVVGISNTNPPISISPSNNRSLNVATQNITANVKLIANKPYAKKLDFINTTTKFNSNNKANATRETSVINQNITDVNVNITDSQILINATIAAINHTDNLTYFGEDNYNQSILLNSERIGVSDDHDINDDGSENLSAAGITGITLGCVVVVGVICGISYILYRNRGFNRPQVLNDRCSNPDSSGYIDDGSVRDNSEEMYSLDNDSFLNSLEAMTIQNYWTDTVKHTKL